MVREDLINSAISFLQDPSVAAAPIEKKIAFLQSKNLTQEEIDASLARVGDAPVAQAPQGAYPPQQYRPPPAQYGQYPPQWAQAPPEPPKRDWRDWFIMATVMGGVGYGIYFTAKRYIIPLIAPPTPPQLEQDKQTIDQSFEKAFALLDQLGTDTEALKAAEQTRTERLDSALNELESVLSSLKDNDRKREDDARRNADEIRNLRDLIPKALEGQKDATDARLKNLSEELKSLSKLITNRVGGSSGPASSGPSHRPTGSGSGLGYTPSSTAPTAQPNGLSQPSNGQVLGSSSSSGTAVQTPADPVASPTVGGSASSGAGVPERSATSTPFGGAGSGSLSRFGSSSANGGAGKASIPAWQMAATKKSVDDLNAGAKKDGAASPAIEATS